MATLNYIGLNYLFATILFSSNCFAQTMKEYLSPSQGKNVSVFRVPKMREMKTRVYYKDKGDSIEITTLYYTEKGMQGWIKQLVKIDSFQASVIKIKSDKLVAAEIYKPNELILLKMPPREGKLEWEDSDHSGSIKSSYSVEFSVIKVGFEKKKAIKFTTNRFKKRSGKELTSQIDYFVAGIGLYRTTSNKGRPIEILEEQISDPNPPMLK